MRTFSDSWRRLKGDQRKTTPVSDKSALGHSSLFISKSFCDLQVFTRYHTLRFDRWQKPRWVTESDTRHSFLPRAFQFPISNLHLSQLLYDHVMNVNFISSCEESICPPPSRCRQHQSTSMFLPSRQTTKWSKSMLAQRESDGSCMKISSATAQTSSRRPSKDLSRRQPRRSFSSKRTTLPPLAFSSTVSTAVWLCADATIS